MQKNLNENPVHSKSCDTLLMTQKLQTYTIITKCITATPSTGPTIRSYPSSFIFTAFRFCLYYGAINSFLFKGLLFATYEIGLGLLPTTQRRPTTTRIRASAAAT